MKSSPRKEKAMWSSIGKALGGGALGLFSGSVIAFIALFIPVFHFEMSMFALFPIICLGGLIAGILGATRGLVYGGLAGSLSFGTLWFIMTMRIRYLPPEIPIAGTIAVVIASFIASSIASLLGHLKWGNNLNNRSQVSWPKAALLAFQWMAMVTVLGIALILIEEWLIMTRWVPFSMLFAPVSVAFVFIPIIAGLVYSSSRVTCLAYIFAVVGWLLFAFIANYVYSVIGGGP